MPGDKWQERRGSGGGDGATPGRTTRSKGPCGRVQYLVGGEGAGADELHGLGHLEGVAEVSFGRHGQLKKWAEAAGII